MNLTERLRKLGRGDPAGLNVTTSLPVPKDREAVSDPLSKIKERADTLVLALKLKAGDKEVDEEIQKLNKRVSAAKSGLEKLAKLLVPDGAEGDEGADAGAGDPFGGGGFGEDAGAGTDAGGTLKQSALQEIADALTEASKALAPAEELSAYLKSVQDQSRKDAAKGPSPKGQHGKAVPVKPAPASKPQDPKPTSPF